MDNRHGRRASAGTQLRYGRCNKSEKPSWKLRSLCERRSQTKVDGGWPPMAGETEDDDAAVGGRVDTSVGGKV